MKKPDKRETINLFFSAFLIIAFIVCAHFFTQFTTTLPTTAAKLVTVAIYAIFGLLVFYATRVGDGKAVKRFSPLTLIVLVVPALYIIVASVVTFLPLNNIFAPGEGAGTISIITTLASVALGYGIPYTFISGFELETENAVEADETGEEAPEVLEGGVEADLIADEAEGEIAADASEQTENAAEAIEKTAEDAAQDAVEDPGEA